MKQTEKYGVPTAVSLVVGSVIGSGVFFKAETVAKITGGNIRLGTFSWLLGGVGMVFCLLSFAAVLPLVDGSGDLSDITAKTVGKGYSRRLGWFMTTIYYPALAAVLAWLCADYSLRAAGIENAGDGVCMVLAIVLITASFVQNTFFSCFSGKVQVITTILKLIPLAVMIASGIGGGERMETMNSFTKTEFEGKPLFSAVSAIMFAYEGWIAALCIGPELKNSRKNLPVALVIGGILILAVYVFYYIGIMSVVPADAFLNYGRDAVKIAFTNVVGTRLSGLLLGFVAISCYGALNGMMFSLGRGMYFLADKGMGPCPEVFAAKSTAYGTPVASFVAGLIYAFLWLLFLFESGTGLLGKFGFDISEIPVVTVYAMYIPIFVSALKKWRGELNGIKKSILILGTVSCIFTSTSALVAHITDISDYLIVFTVIMLVGELYQKSE